MTMTEHGAILDYPVWMHDVDADSLDLSWIEDVAHTFGLDDDDMLRLMSTEVLRATLVAIDGIRHIAARNKRAKQSTFDATSFCQTCKENGETAKEAIGSLLHRSILELAKDAIRAELESHESNNADDDELRAMAKYRSDEIDEFAEVLFGVVSSAMLYADFMKCVDCDEIRCCCPKCPSCQNRSPESSPHENCEQGDKDGNGMCPLLKKHV